MENLKDLARELGQGYDYLLLVDGESLLVCSLDGTETPVHTNNENLESVVYRLYREGYSIRLVYYVDNAGRYSLPDLDEFNESKGWDY